MNPPANQSRSHKIRLHGPWQFESARQADENLQLNEGAIKKRKVQLPCKLDEVRDVSLAAAFKLSRTFGCPTELTADQKIWLVIESTGVSGKAFLNDQNLGVLNDGGLRTEISQRLQQRNSLRMELDPHRGDANAAEIQSVRLEIEEREGGAPSPL